MPRRFKVGDRVEGKIAEIRNFAGVITEIIILRHANQIKVRWDNGLEGNYSGRALQFPPDQAILRAPEIPPPNALAGIDVAMAAGQPVRRNLIAYNQEYDDSTAESNYGSRLERLRRFWRFSRNLIFTVPN